MEVFIIKAKTKEEVWEIIKKDSNDSDYDMDYLKSHYFIVDLATYLDQEIKVIWGNSSLTQD